MTLLIGGIAAGRWMDVRDDYVQVVETPAIPYNKKHGLDPGFPTMTMQSSVYKKMKLCYKVGKREESFVFLVDERIRDEFDLIRELANGYHPVCVSKL